VKVTNEGGGTTLATYLYDALGHRVQTVVGSANTEFVFNPAGQRVSTWNGGTGAQIQGQYYWGAKPGAFCKGGQTYFQHQDWEGTERLRTTYNGSTEGAFASLPFGDALQLTAGSDNDANRYGMLDHDYESDTEHAQFRQYNSAQGHWLSPDPCSGSYDPSNPQSFNRYVYVLDNPLSLTDPSGLECVWDDGSHDSEDDPTTGSPSSCKSLGGTWIELGEDGGWSGAANASLAGLTGVPGISGAQLDGNGNVMMYSVGTSVFNGDGTPFQNSTPDPTNPTIYMSGTGFSLSDPSLTATSTSTASYVFSSSSFYTSYVPPTSPYLIPGTQCSSGCHKEPPTVIQLLSCADVNLEGVDTTTLGAAAAVAGLFPSPASPVLTGGGLVIALQGGILQTLAGHQIGCRP